MKKGYVFTLAAFVLLLVSFYLVIIKSENVKLLEETYGTLTKTHTLVEYSNLINRENIKSFMNASIKYSLAMLAFHVGDAPLKDTPDTNNFSAVLKDLVSTGRADGSYFSGEEGMELSDKDLTFVGLNQKINERAKKSGFEYNITLKDLKVQMSNYDTMKVEYSVEIRVRDLTNNTGKVVSYDNEMMEINISGLPDPIAERLLSSYEVDRSENSFYMPIIFGEKPPIGKTIGLQGNNWVYGRIYTDPAKVPHNHDEPNILMGRFDTVKDYIDDERIDGFIIVEPNIQKEVACPHIDPAGNTYYNETNTFNDVCDKYNEDTGECEEGHWVCNETDSLYPIGSYEKAWIFIQGDSEEIKPGDYEGIGENDLGQNTTLILTNNYAGKEDKENSPIMLVDVEGWRDLINCGKALPLAVKKEDGSYAAPDYIQRFYEKPWELSSPFGYIMFFIEDEFESTGDLSSVGFERLDGRPGKAIRGLAGCKSTKLPTANCNLPTTLRISEELLGLGACPLEDLRELAK